uniref:Cell wall/surface repeat protein n=1 Tax=uncultured bacterium contig00032 TaxID=1181521 RepID=A0A806JY22_9BACT|nr:cell wall/surface repeat protein [uncultured bacterium contig00032]
MNNYQLTVNKEQRKGKIKVALLFSLFVLLFSFTACDHGLNSIANHAKVKDGYGIVTVNIGGVNARTTFPQAVFDDAEYSFTKNGSPMQPENAIGSTFTLETGSGWVVTVKGYKNVDSVKTLVAQGSSEPFTVNNGSNPAVAVKLAIVGAVIGEDGILNISITKPNEAAMTLELENLFGDEQLTVTQGNNTIAAGIYLLNVRLEMVTGAVKKYAGASEVVYVYPHMTTAYAHTFLASHFSAAELIHIAVTKLPDQVVYERNGQADPEVQRFRPDGIEITGTYSNGRKELIDPSEVLFSEGLLEWDSVLEYYPPNLDNNIMYEVDQWGNHIPLSWPRGLNTTANVIRDIHAVYGGFHASFPVLIISYGNVAAFEANGLEFSTEQDLNYDLYGTLDLSGLEVYARDFVNLPLPHEWLEFDDSEFDNTTPGEYPIHVTLSFEFDYMLYDTLHHVTASKTSSFTVTVAKYTVTFDANGGGWAGDVTAITESRFYGETATPPQYDPFKESNLGKAVRFFGWQKEGDDHLFDFATPITGNTVIKAAYITFDANGGAWDTIPAIVFAGNTVTFPPAPVKSGIGLYAGVVESMPGNIDLLGWVRQGSETAETASPAAVGADTTFTAKWALDGIDLTGTAGANLVAQAINYANARSGQQFTLYISETYSFSAGLRSYGKLIVKGSPSATIARTSNANIVLLTISGGEFTLGDGVTLHGNIASNTVVQNNLVAVSGGTFYQTGGSITGHRGWYASAGAVFVNAGGNHSSVFVKTGGSLSGNGVYQVVSGSYQSVTGGAQVYVQYASGTRYRDAAADSAVAIDTRDGTGLSGTGTIPAYYPLTIPPDSHTPLTADTWTDGTISSSSEYFSFNATAGTTYYVWWNGGYLGYGDGTKTLDINASAYYDNGTEIFAGINQGWTAPRSFTPTSDGTVYVRIYPYTAGGTGTFAVVYSTGSTRP